MALKRYMYRATLTEMFFDIFNVAHGTLDMLCLAYILCDSCLF